MNTKPNTPASRNEEAVPDRGPRVEHLCRAICAYIDVNPDQVLDYADGKPSKLAWHRHDMQAARLLRELDALAAPGAAIDAREQEAGRSTFEAAYIDRLGMRMEDYDLSFDERDNRYGDDDVQSAWWAWQARGALMPAASAPAPSEALSPATVAQPVGVPAGWKIQPDEEGTRVVSPSGDVCYLWDLDSRHEDAGQGHREVLRQLCQDLLFGAQPCATQGCATDKSGGAE